MASRGGVASASRNARPNASVAPVVPRGDSAVSGQVFALFTIAVAAAEVGVGLAIILLIYRNRTSVDLDEVDMMKG